MIIHKCSICGKIIREDREPFYREKGVRNYIYYCRKCYANKRWKELKAEKKHLNWYIALIRDARMIRMLEIPKEEKEKIIKEFLENVPTEVENKIRKILGV